MNFRHKSRSAYIVLLFVAFSITFYTYHLSGKGTLYIDWYKKHISPLNTFICPYYPTCSQYTKQAIQKYGFVKGCVMGCDRLMRCSHDPWVYPTVNYENEIKKYDPVR